MNYKTLAPGICVTTQVFPDALPALHAAGFRTIINDRPDLEEPDQPDSADLAAAAEAFGIAYHNIPVIAGQIEDSQVEAFADALAHSPRPALAFCKSGMRAASLWALSQAGTLPVAEILRHASACGYDLSPLVPRIERRAGTLRA